VRNFAIRKDYFAEMANPFTKLQRGRKVYVCLSPFKNLRQILTCAQVPARVGDDPDGGEHVEPVLPGRLDLGDVHGDADEEDGVGEGGVDAAVERGAPLFGEPRYPRRRADVLESILRISAEKFSENFSSSNFGLLNNQKMLRI
jgi:hypothetical protein